MYCRRPCPTACRCQVTRPAPSLTWPVLLPALPALGLALPILGLVPLANAPMPKTLKLGRINNVTAHHQTIPVAVTCIATGI
jgi:hypothetical protein